MAEEPTTEETGGKEPAWYREQIDKANEKAAVLESKLKDQMLGSIPGLDPSKGLGKTMVDSYDGDLDKEQFLAWASEKYEFKPSGDDPDGSSPGAQDVNRIVAENEARADEALSQSASLGRSDDLDERIAAAEADQNTQLAIALKTQKAISLKP